MWVYPSLDSFVIVYPLLQTVLQGTGVPIVCLLRLIMLCVSFAEISFTGYSVSFIVQKVQRDLQDTDRVVSLFFSGRKI